MLLPEQLHDRFLLENRNKLSLLKTIWGLGASGDLIYPQGAVWSAKVTHLPLDPRQTLYGSEILF